MNKLAETVIVVGQALELDTSSAEAQLVERRHAPVIMDNIGAREMRENADSDAASAMQRVTGLSVVDNQYIFVRGLGERYSNTTLGGSVIPTTEPDKKVVPLDIFPTGLIDSVQVSKSYTPDRSADFAGGLVQVMPLKLPSRPVFDLSYGYTHYERGTGDAIPLSALGRRDWLGFDDGARALPSQFPNNKVVRRGVYTPDVGYSTQEIAAFGRLLDQTWSPRPRSGKPGQNWSIVGGNRFGRLGLVGSFSESYRENYVEENRKFFRLEQDGALEAVTDYDFQIGTQKAQVGATGTVSYQFAPSQRLSYEVFYTHSGRDEGRLFEGPNTENNQYFRNMRLQFIEEGLTSHAASGEHFFQSLGNSRVDWRVAYARANRDEPDLRETLYQANITTAPSARVFLLADESQSGFRMFNNLDDDTVDVQVNWAVAMTLNGLPAQLKFGPQYVTRQRDFASRRFRYIPANVGGVNLSQAPEQLFTPDRIGTTWRFNEETRPVDAYDAEMETVAFYGMSDLALSSRARLIGGVRVEKFRETVNTKDPFSLFQEVVTAAIENTDVFPGVNFVYAVQNNQNIRLSYSQTVNRPEFRELAAFEFTDVVGNRAVRGNPALTRALIQNVDVRYELFPGARGVVAGSVFFKHFNDPIERVINAGAQPLATFENADKARNVGLELEAARQLGPNLRVNVNYTYVASEITLTDAARRAQTSLTRPLAGQSKNLFNGVFEVAGGPFSTRVLVNYFGDRISDVGANGAPDIVEAGRATLDWVASYRWNRMSARFQIDNLADADYRFTQGDEDQRLFRLGRTFGLSFGYSFY
jgi:hypothetical protein